MNLEWNDRRMRQFTTNVGLITSKGKRGYNIMAAEWTHAIADAPAALMVCVNNEHETRDNIEMHREFGVNLASSDQNIITSIAGKVSGHDVDKINVLKEYGASFSNASLIDCPLLDGACFHAECKLIHTIPLGSHTAFIGEILALQADIEKQPLVYHNGKYYALESTIPKPDAATLQRLDALLGKYRYA